MTEQLLNIERGGHRINMDRRDGYVRVNCNGATHAQFNEVAIGEVKALEHAISFAAQLEANALKYPNEEKRG